MEPESPTRPSRTEMEKLVAALRNEPDARLLLQRLNEALGTAGQSPRELRINLLGGLSILVRDRWESGPPPMRGRRVIQYLALHRNSVASRERLSELLWPRLDADDATHRLHVAVSGARAYLRRALGGVDAIRCVRGGYAWSQDVSIVTDVIEFLEAACGPREDLQRAHSLYSGELLSGDDDDWIEPLRVRCAAVYASVLERLADNAVSQGEFAQALGLGLELVAMDRGHEGASRLVMRCFGALGRRGRALAEFEALRAHLRKHLGLEPTAETRQLIRAVLGEAEERISQSSATFKA
jgi:DNA-binding SARP family transcriptional activator